MHIAYFFGALIIVMGDTGTLQAANLRENKHEERTLLKELQKEERKQANNATVTWNEILADVLVKNLNIFSKNKEDYGVPEKPKGFATKCFSNILYIYKSVYDVVYSTGDTYEDQTSTTTESNPKDEVEVIDAVLGNESCENCDDEKPDKNIQRDLMKCPDGYVKNDDGNCENSVSSRIIMAVPNQCPTGYKPDRFGYCRIMFNF